MLIVKIRCILHNMERLKTFKYRLYPTKAQRVLLAKHFGASRWVYNWCLARKIEEYTKNKRTMSKFELSREITALKSQPDTAWLNEVNAQSLQSAIAHLDSAYTKFFREKVGFPKFKSKKKSKLSAEFRQDSKLDVVNSLLSVMKFREGIRCKNHRNFNGEIRTVTISQAPSGKYHACVLVKEEVAGVKRAPLEIDRATGIDLGIKSLIVTSKNEVFDNPKHLNKSLKKLAKVQRQLAKKKVGGKNRHKQRIRVALIHEKISNQRRNDLHKISRQLVDDNQVTTFCLETLNVSGMLKNRCLAKAISDAGWNTFVSFLEYKAAWAGKNILRIGQFEPSSRTCNVCGAVNSKLRLSDRVWTCSCGATHDRDFLAACNIRDFAFAAQNLIGVGHPESKPVEKSSLSGRSVKQGAASQL